MQTIDCKLSLLVANTGQIPGLPGNPRQWTRDEVRRLAQSIEQTPELLEARPIIAVHHEAQYVVLGGNLRLAALKHLGRKSAPVYLVPAETPAEKLREIVIKDNGAFGSWDFDALANEWDFLPLTEWGVPAWNTEGDAQHQMNNGGLSTEGQEGEEGYGEFVDKFKPKLTTDDCYTPPAVYDAVVQFVGTITDTKDRKIVRPFFPGGNYEDLTQYPEGCIVIDNPPFSILSAILRFYTEHAIPFFLFAPSLTLFSATDCDLTYIISNSEIIYENGARVRTGFITNVIPDVRIWVCPQLGQATDDAQADEDKTKQGFIYPDNIITAALLSKIAKRRVELRIRKASCYPIHDSDSAKEQGRGLYGGGFLLSDRAAGEKAEAEQEAARRAIEDRENVEIKQETLLELSDREKAIVAKLNVQDKEQHQKTRNAAKTGGKAAKTGKL